MRHHPQLLVAWASAALVIGLLLLSCGGEARSTTPTATPTISETPAAATPTPRPATEQPRATPTVEPATPTPSTGTVVRLKIPALSVDAPIEPIGLIVGENQLDVPKDPHNVGWYDIYSRPGWGGNAFFSAHVDYYPNIKGAFFKLATLTAGQEVIVIMEDGAEYRYAVLSNTRYLAEDMPMGDIISPPTKPVDDEWITLITCGGEARPAGGGRVEYLHRDVVVAARIR